MLFSFSEFENENTDLPDLPDLDDLSDLNDQILSFDYMIEEQIKR